MLLGSAGQARAVLPPALPCLPVKEAAWVFWQGVQQGRTPSPTLCQRPCREFRFDLWCTLALSIMVGGPMDTLHISDLLLGFLLALTVGVRMSVAEDYLPKTWRYRIRVYLVWADAVLIALPIGLCFGLKPALIALLPFIPLTVLGVLILRVLADSSSVIIKTSGSMVTDSGDTSRSATVVPFRRNR